MKKKNGEDYEFSFEFSFEFSILNSVFEFSF